MPKRAYVVAVDARTIGEDITAVKDFIRNSSSISSWWNYIPYVWIVVSPLTADELSAELRPLTGDTNFLVLEANLNHSEGWLPEKAWIWLRKYARRLSGALAKGTLNQYFNQAP